MAKDGKYNEKGKQMNRIERYSKRLTWFFMAFLLPVLVAGCGHWDDNKDNNSGAVLTSIAVTPATPSIAIGAPKQFTATGTYADGTSADITTSVIWSSGTTGSATVNASGIATGVAAGTSVITATSGDKTATATLTVTTATLASIAVTATNPSIATAATKQFTATATYSDDTSEDITRFVTWTSGTPGVATIDANGLATGLAAGTSVITATSGSKTANTTLTVTSATLASIAVTPALPSIAPAATKQFTATATYSDNTSADITTQVIWSSGTTGVATINASGLATGVVAGTSVITATSGVKTGNTTLTVAAATPPVGVGPAPVDLGAAGNFVILGKSAVSTVPTSAVTGNIGVSPAAASFITGFGLIADSTNVFSTSTQVIGKVYASNFAVPTPSNLTTAISNMETAYTDAAGRTVPAAITELGAGDISGMTLAPGLYKWGTGLSINSNVTLNGNANDVWIFQIAGGITQATATRVNLTGDAQAKNVFWQSFGTVAIGTGAHFEGVVLAKTAINLGTGASVNGRLYAQTAVSLDANTVTQPAP
jgi:uncharacterized protein YjdB